MFFKSYFKQEKIIEKSDLKISFKGMHMQNDHFLLKGKKI